MISSVFVLLRLILLAKSQETRCFRSRFLSVFVLVVCYLKANLDLWKSNLEFLTAHAYHDISLKSLNKSQG